MVRLGLIATVRSMISSIRTTTTQAFAGCRKHVHRDRELVPVPAPPVIAEAVAYSDGTSYSAGAVEGGEVEVSFDVASSPVTNGSAAVVVTFDAFSADGSLIA